MVYDDSDKAATLDDILKATRERAQREQMGSFLIIAAVIAAIALYIGHERGTHQAWDKARAAIHNACFQNYCPDELEAYAEGATP